MTFRLRHYLILFLLLTGCGQSSQQTVLKAGNIKVIDFRGKPVTLHRPATRIVCLIESALSGLYMLNAENQVVGISSGVYNESAALQYAKMDERVKNKELPAVGNWDFVSLENLVALQPDLVIIWSSQNESIDAIEEKGIPVYGVFIKSFNDIYKEISDLGVLTGKKSRADSINNYTKKEVELLYNQSTKVDKKMVYFMWTQGLLETSGTTSTVNELIELAGATNVCRLPYEHVVINKETLLESNPDIILMWYNNSQNPADIWNLPELQGIKAIRNRNVCELPNVFWCDLWTLKYQYAVKVLAKYCHPDSFGNLNPEEEKKKMIVMLYGQKGQNIFR
jgi:iron complex transport system substrate-binding protein